MPKAKTASMIKLRHAAEEAVKAFYLTTVPNPRAFVSYMTDEDLAVFVAHIPVKLIDGKHRADVCKFHELNMNEGVAA